jgi:hypothetical protein
MPDKYHPSGASHHAIANRDVMKSLYAAELRDIAAKLEANEAQILCCGADGGRRFVKFRAKDFMFLVSWTRHQPDNQTSAHTRAMNESESIRTL